MPVSRLATYSKNIFEGHVAGQYMNGEGRPDTGSEGAKMLGTTSVTSYFGPSFMIDDLTYHYAAGDHQALLINCHDPIDANSFVLQYGIIVQKSKSLPAEEAVKAATRLGDYVSWASSRTSRSGGTRPASTIRCWSRRTGRSTNCGAGMSSSALTSVTCSRTWWTASSSNWTPVGPIRRG